MCDEESKIVANCSGWVVFLTKRIVYFVKPWFGRIRASRIQRKSLKNKIENRSEKVCIIGSKLKQNEAHMHM